MNHRLRSADIVYQRWTTIRRLHIEAPSGRTVIRDLEDHGDAAVILPYDRSRRTAIVIEQSRHSKLFVESSDMSLEPIAGRIDAGETAEVAARREAMEEAGLRIGCLEKVVESWSMPAISTERAYLFFAEYCEGDRIATGGGLDDEDEYIIVHEIALSRLASMAQKGELTDAKLHLMTLALLVAKPELFA